MNELLIPDGFYNDWYGFITNQMGHFVFGMFAFALVAWLIGRFQSLIVLIIFYVGWELYQFRYSHDIKDAIADFGFVVLGALFAWAAWVGGRKVMVAVLTALGISLAVGVAKRLPKD